MADLFKEILPSILTTKQYVLEEEKDYVPYIINKALSHHKDCIFYANEMNMMHGLAKSMQYSYFINTIRKGKRPYGKWHKPIENKDLQAVKTYFGYSDQKAEETLKVLTEDQLKIIRTKTTIGE
jgi:hypothetical protein